MGRRGQRGTRHLQLGNVVECRALTASPHPVRAVEDKINSIMSAAEDAIQTLKNECKLQLVLLPAKVRPARWRRPATSTVASLFVTGQLPVSPQM